MSLLLLLLLLLVFLDMKKTLAASRATRVVPSQAAGMDVAFLCHVSITTPVSMRIPVSFVAISEAQWEDRCRKTIQFDAIQFQVKRDDKINLNRQRSLK